LARSIMAADLRKSDFDPPRAAIMKSAGEQSAGHAFWQGFSSQEMHLSSSPLSWASVRKWKVSFMPFGPVKAT
jgi:hypothetical protein